VHLLHDFPWVCRRCAQPQVASQADHPVRHIPSDSVRFRQIPLSSVILRYLRCLLLSSRTICSRRATLYLTTCSLHAELHVPILCCVGVLVACFPHVSQCVVHALFSVFLFSIMKYAYLIPEGLAMFVSTVTLSRCHALANAKCLQLCSLLVCGCVDVALVLGVCLLVCGCWSWM
jgi:hypothetical protein